MIKLINRKWQIKR